MAGRPASTIFDGVNLVRVYCKSHAGLFVVSRIRSPKFPARRRTDPAPIRSSDFGPRPSRRQAGPLPPHFSFQLSAFSVSAFAPSSSASARGLPDREDNHERRPNFCFLLSALCFLRAALLLSLSCSFLFQSLRPSPRGFGAGAGTSGARRVRGWPCGHPLPLEPYGRFSPHTARAVTKPRSRGTGPTRRRVAFTIRACSLRTRRSQRSQSIWSHCCARAEEAHMDRSTFICDFLPGKVLPALS